MCKLWHFNFINFMFRKTRLTGYDYITILAGSVSECVIMDSNNFPGIFLQFQIKPLLYVINHWDVGLKYGTNIFLRFWESVGGWSESA